MMVSVTKVFEISYAHYLQDYEGKCKNLHGHNAKIELEFGDINFAERNVVDPDHTVIHTQSSGMVMDFTVIKNKAEKLVKDTLDHKYLNDIPYFLETRPTAENMCVLIMRVLSHFENLIRVRVWEDCDSYAEWRL